MLKNKIEKKKKLKAFNGEKIDGKIKKK